MTRLCRFVARTTDSSDCPPRSFCEQVPIDDFFRQDVPDEEVMERLRGLGCKEFGVETEAELEDFIEQEIPEFKLVR